MSCMVESLVLKRWFESFCAARWLYARFTPMVPAGHDCELADATIGVMKNAVPS